MSSIIHNCGYDQSGRSNFTPVNPLTPLQYHGALDISHLLQQIVEQDFGYTGTSQYTLVLRDDRMVLDLINSSSPAPSTFGHLDLQNGQWTLTKTSGGTTTTLANPTQISARVHETLSRISSAYNSVRPGAIPSPHSMAQVQASPAAPTTVVNNHITCDHTSLNATMAAFQRMMESYLQTLQQHLTRPQIAPQANTNATEIQALSASIAELHRSLEQLKSAQSQPSGFSAILLAMQENFNQLQRELAKVSQPSSEIPRHLQAEIAELRRQLDALAKTPQPLPQGSIQPSADRDTLTLKDREIALLKADQEKLACYIGTQEYELQQQIATLEAANEQSNENNQEMLSILEEFEAENKQLRADMNEKSQDIENLTVQIQRNAINKDAPQDELAELELALQARNEEVRLLTQHNKSLKGEKEKLVEELLSRHPSKTEIEPLKQKIATLKAAAEKANRAAKALSTTVDEAVAFNAAGAARIESLTTQNQLLQQQLEQSSEGQQAALLQESLQTTESLVTENEALWKQLQTAAFQEKEHVRQNQLREEQIYKLSSELSQTHISNLTCMGELTLYNNQEARAQISKNKELEAETARLRAQLAATGQQANAVASSQPVQVLEEEPREESQLDEPLQINSELSQLVLEINKNSKKNLTEEEINKFLTQIETTLGTLGNKDSVTLKEIGPLVQNLALLEHLPLATVEADTKINTWIESKFKTPISSNNLQQIRISLQLHYKTAIKDQQRIQEYAQMPNGIRDLGKVLVSCLGHELYAIQSLQKAISKIAILQTELKKTEKKQMTQLLGTMNSLVKTAHERLHDKTWTITGY